MENQWTDCWLEYPFLMEDTSLLTISSDFTGIIAQNAVKEIKLAVKGLYHMTAEVSERSDSDPVLSIQKDPSVPSEGYQIKSSSGKCVIHAADERGALYGVFAWLKELQLHGCLIRELTKEISASPSNPLRMLNHWDNMDGSIERGYSGLSFFFENSEVLTGDRIRAYARMAASVGINGVVINNVNVKDAAIDLISHRFYQPLRKIQEIFAAYGIKLFLCIEYAAPILMGGLTTSDPCDRAVQAWWAEKAAEVWENLPGLGGFMVKADSEGRPGPFAYGRNHADGANMLAAAVKPHGGLIIWRCFVYNCRQDWRDTRTDRACACTNHYQPLDGQFDSNVILQIKNGPMDFQVREPVNPLFGRLSRTNMMLEVQIAQEYTGQQIHVCYLIPMFKEILNQNMHCSEDPCTVADLVSTRTYNNAFGGIAAVANTGNDLNWTGHDLAAANLYGFGRLAYDTSLTSEDIAKEWICLTFGKNEKIQKILLEILMKSWPAYENYNAPLGIGWMCNPNQHYGPSVEGYEYQLWGTYIRANWEALGVDRTMAGTGYTGQYHQPLAGYYDDIQTCPDNVALFFHRLRYDHVLKSGKTVLQHIYDTHFEGCDTAGSFVDAFETLKEDLSPEVYKRIHTRLVMQKEHAKEWRDVINTYFYRRTGIPDAHGRKIYD